MAITHLVLARLTDRRLQAWAQKDGVSWTRCMAEGNPNSWTPWEPFVASLPRTAVVGAGVLSNGANQIFGLADQPQWPQANVTRWKVSKKANAPWTEWVPLGFDGECIEVTAQSLPDGRMQVFALSKATHQGRPRVLTRCKTEVAPDAPLSGVDTMRPPESGLTSLVALRLSDGRIQLIGGTNDRLRTTCKRTVDPDAAWEPWTDLAANPSVNSTVRLAWAPLPDRRPQVWSVNRSGVLSSSWKASVNANAAWTTWAPVEGAPPNLVDIAAERLSDGRVQLWAANQAGSLLFTEKKSDHPDAGWKRWQPSAAP